MSSEQTHHEDLVNGFYNQLKQIFDESPQAIYLYLDDNHKVCNEKFASLLGYNSPEEWAKIKNPLGENVDKNSQDTVASNYFNATEKMIASQMDVKMKTTTGSVFETSAIVVPVVYQKRNRKRTQIRTQKVNNFSDFQWCEIHFSPLFLRLNFIGFS